jgi:hypothetical protein
VTATQAFEVMDNLFGAKHTPHGIEAGPFRLERGGGIAGNLGCWWLTAPGDVLFARQGPFRTVGELRTYWRRYMRDLMRAADGAAYWLAVMCP